MEDAARHKGSETLQLQPCARGCGYFGCRATHNLCSVCYLEYLTEQLISRQDPTVRNFLANVPLIFGKGFAAVTTAAAENINTPSNKNRCLCCNKKVGILGFRCRCGATFCGVHRYPETHHCKFDYKSVGRAAIAEQNPLVKADKMANRI